mgnify:CR=1 FL=1
MHHKKTGTMVVKPSYFKNVYCVAEVSRVKHMWKTEHTQDAYTHSRYIYYTITSKRYQCGITGAYLTKAAKKRHRDYRTACSEELGCTFQ